MSKIGLWVVFPLLFLLGWFPLPATAASVVQLESGAIDVYESPTLPVCPDGREQEMFALPAEREREPDLVPVSIHQVESEFYSRFRAITEEDWNAVKSWRRVTEKVPLLPERAIYGASVPGPFYLRKEVFGFHPYWEGTGYTNYTFGLLSTVAYFSYEVNPTTGYAVTMNNWSNTPLVDWARSNGTKVVLVATLFSDHSTFLGSSAAQSNLISELIRVVRLRNAHGVNIDFEGMSSTHRAPFTAFVSNLAARLKSEIPAGQVSVCLPPVDWNNVFDVAAYNGFVDYCVLMGYDYYWRTGPNAGPVAPLRPSTIFGSQCVGRSVSNYLAAGLAPYRLIVGVPYYGYEWPTVSTNLAAATTGPGTARVYSVASSRAQTYGKRWDTNSLTPYYLYGAYVQGWFEDTNSLRAKYSFFLDKDLAGVGIWALGYDDTQPELWDLLAENFAGTSSVWSVRTLGITNGLYGVVYGSNVFVAVGAGGYVATSVEGTNWISRAPGTTKLLLNVRYGGGLFVAVGDGGTVVVSSNGVNWSIQATPVTNMLRGVTWGAQRFVAVGNEGTILTSTNGLNWATASSGTTNGLQGVAYGNGMFVAVGNDGQVRTSTNGINWVAQSSGVVNWLLDVCFGANLFVAVGTGGRIVTSPDGVNWTARGSGTTNMLYRVGWNGSNFVAVGVAGTVLRSFDGRTWSIDKVGTTETLRDVGYGAGVSVAVGFNSLVLTAGTYEPPSEPPPSPPAADGPITPEPFGSLSNIVIYCSAGHGFYAETNSGNWYTGRTLTNGIVEDMGNLDQLNFLVQYLRNAGATVVPFRPVGYQTNEVVLDNDDVGVTFTGTWYNSSSTIFYGNAGDVPYRYAYISTGEQTAVARYVPNLPVAGFYPVYAWALHANNRVRQLYRIRHSGGVNEVRVNHRRVGAGWVWLGTYYFDAGTNGYVEISNHAPGYDPSSHVVIADAIRFGNGMGDVDRGFGVSGYERELEASRYWIQRMVGQGMPSDLYDRPTLNDNDDNVGAPARMADYMDNESDGDFFDRLYLGLHSNADGGAGTAQGPMGLYSTGNSTGTQARQQAYGLALAREITNDFYYLQNGVGFNDPWSNNTVNIYGSVYGEISEGYNSNMNSTIIEVAYHNNVADARLLRDPSARMYYARSILKGIIRYLNSVNPSVPLVFPPDPPQAPVAVNVSNGVYLSWVPAPTNVASGHAATGFRVYSSTNGYGFGQPVFTTNTSVLLTNLVAGRTYFFHVTAINSGGESLPSEVVGVRVSPSRRAYHLVVNGFTRFDRTQSPTRYFGANINGAVTLVRPRRINSFDYVVQHGQAVAAGGRFFDSCGHAAVIGGRVSLTNYHAAYWILGEESTTNETFSSVEQAIVTNYLARGGNLFVSGSELGWDLGARGTLADGAFLTNWLRAGYVADTAGTNRVIPSTAGLFAGMASFLFDDGSAGGYAAEYPDILMGRGGATTALVYGTSASGTNAAAIQYSGSYRLVVMGFPFESILDFSVRTNLMKRVLTFFGDSPEETPVIRITTASTTVPYAVSNIYVQGTNNAAVVGYLAWTNLLTAQFGSCVASLSWTITNVSLAVGTNWIVVWGTNAYGVVTNDSVAVVRQAPQETSAILIDEPFDDAPTAPPGWTFVGVDAYTTTGAAGRAPPSVKFDSYGDYILSKPFIGGTNLTFFLRAYPASGTNSVGTFAVDGYMSGSWVTLLVITNPVNVGSTVSVSVALSTWQLRFTWNKTAGNVALDDVIVLGPAGMGDTDNDGIPDNWELTYFGSVTGAVPWADNDADLQSNWQEFVAGTDPTSADSVFEIYAVSNAGANFTFRWPSAPGRIYAVRTSTNLLLGLTPFVTNISATPPENVFVDNINTGQTLLYYDVKVSLP